MVEPIANGHFSPALLDVMLVMLSGMLPALLVAYGWQLLSRRRVWPEFSLRKSEAAELDRALLLYRKAASRLDQLCARGHKTDRGWRAMFLRPAHLDHGDADEWEDLQAFRRHLGATIVRLRRLPFQRLRERVHALSLRAALGRGLAVHLAVFVLLAVALRTTVPLVLARALVDPAEVFPIGAFDQSLLQANAGAACLALMLLPGFYWFRRGRLRHEFGLEFCVLKELAAMPPDQANDRAAAEIGISQASPPLAGDCTDNWCDILGVASSASIGEVRDAYKALIKQNHPDRMQDLSPAIRRFAEAQTKRLNVAYEQALSCLS